jgi:hypothetical protein
VSDLIHLADHAHDRRTELDLDTVEGAIRMVASGAARRIVLVNLTQAAAILPVAIATGQRAGVIVRGDRSTGNLAIEVTAAQ